MDAPYARDLTCLNNAGNAGNASHAIKTVIKHDI